AVAGAFLVASVWFFFRSVRREGRSARMMALHFLRLFLAALIAFTLLRPERVVLSKRTEQPRVMVLWDGSGSMATRDVRIGEKETLSRSEWVKQQLESKFWGPIEKRYQVTVEPFAQPPEDG